MRGEVRLRKLKIKYSFFFLAFFMIIFGFFLQFIIIFLFVSLHEAGHIIFAKFFSVETKKVIITPVGETAVMKNIDSVSFWKKFIIFVSGPLVNIFFGTVFLFFDNNIFEFVENINFTLAFFNLLPIYPLDGGRIFMLFLNKFFPIILSNKIIIRVSVAFSVLFIIIGIIQLVLFPYNISFLCIGLYLFKERNKTYFSMTFDFYKHIIKKKNVLGNMTLLKSFYINENFEIKKVLKNFYFDCYCVFYVYVNGKFQRKIFEWEIIDYIQRKGVYGNILDIFRETPYKKG